MVYGFGLKGFGFIV